MSIRTVNELFLHATRNVSNEKAFQHRVKGRYEVVSAAQAERLCFMVALGLSDLGFGADDRGAILSQNRLEWVLADMGMLLLGGVDVPVYPSLIADQVAYILGHAECRVAFCEDAQQADKVLAVRDRLPQLAHIVQFAAEPAAAGVMPFKEVLARGERVYEDRRSRIEEIALAVSPEAPCSIIYTSGTTGQPKGVVLSHGNIVSNVHACLKVFEIDRRDTALSFLPLSHIFERTGGYYALLYAGCSIAYAESIHTVPRDLLDVRPTVLISVPRLFEKMHARILDTALAASFLRKQLFFWARRVGLRWAALTLAGEEIPRLLAHSFRLADRLVFTKIRSRTGGRLRLLVSGGAPLSELIGRFFYAVGLPIMEGYGLTETSPVVAANNPRHYRLGSVGRPVPGVEVKLSADGEILTRGPHVMQGYYKDPEATRATIDAAGWLATGDIGAIDADGYLHITDRKKDLLVTAGGKNVAPQPIETLLKADKFVGEAILLGDQLPFISALIVPHFEYLMKYAKRKSILYTSMAGLVREPRVQDLYRRRVELANSRLARYERIRKFRLLDHELTLEDGELTPTMKVRRQRIAELYKEIIAAMYDEEPPAS
ncbi:MAG: long-chain fatty acid--CoA ligase [Candidatus Krumholzibacteriota bacterium]|nr:long-chain fatty acid--CoA ligase [Candidatus Krumholzibacteriota bacterium]